MRAHVDVVFNKDQVLVMCASARYHGSAKLAKTYADH
jgi:hypothetical protein